MSLIKSGLRIAALTLVGEHPEDIYVHSIEGK